MGTVAVATIWPASLLIIRQKSYEVFLTLHHVFVIIFLVGFYYHIWYCYNYNWGYEIWAFISIAIWAIDRLWRLARTYNFMSPQSPPFLNPRTLCLSQKNNSEHSYRARQQPPLPTPTSEKTNTSQFRSLQHSFSGISQA